MRSNYIHLYHPSTATKWFKKVTTSMYHPNLKCVEKFRASLEEKKSGFPNSRLCKNGFNPWCPTNRKPLPKSSCGFCPHPGDLKQWQVVTSCFFSSQVRRFVFVLHSAKTSIVRNYNVTYILLYCIILYCSRLILKMILKFRLILKIIGLKNRYFLSTIWLLFGSICEISFLQSRHPDHD